MDMMTLARTAAFPPGSSHPGHGHGLQLSISEFLQLGLFRVAYLTQVVDEDGTTSVVLHGADGMAVAAVETVALAEELAEQLGLALVAVH